MGGGPKFLAENREDPEVRECVGKCGDGRGWAGMGGNGWKGRECAGEGGDEAHFCLFRI